MSTQTSQPNGPPNGADEAERARVRTRQEAVLRRFAWLVAGSGAALLAAGAAWGGVDFAKAVLLGFLIVVLNFFWTKRAVKSVLFGEKPRALLALSFLVKFGVTGAVLFYFIVRLQVDALGVMVGLSSLLLASVLYALDLRFTRR